MQQQHVSTRPPHVDYPALPIEVIAHYIAVNRTNKQSDNSLEKRRTTRPSSEIDIRIGCWAVATCFEVHNTTSPAILANFWRFPRIYELAGGAPRFYKLAIFPMFSRLSTNSPFSPFRLPASYVIEFNIPT